MPASLTKSRLSSKDIPPRLARLRTILRKCKSAVVAFSGGSDSTFLLAEAQLALGENLIAFTAASPLIPADEIEACRKLALSLGIRHKFFHINPLEDPIIQNNPPDRCYFCKRAVYEAGLSVAKEENMATFMDGTTQEDLQSGRPGLKAVHELKVRTPLAEAGFNKAEVREWSRLLNLPTWDKPSQSCLATRIPYGTPLTMEALRKVDQAEGLLRKLGFSQVRVRLQENTARIEVPLQELPGILSEEVRKKIIDGFRGLGFTYVTVDMEGFRSGSMDRLRNGIRSDT
jgi:uncharacterized protein